MTFLNTRTVFTPLYPQAQSSFKKNVRLYGFKFENRIFKLTLEDILMSQPLFEHKTMVERNTLTPIPSDVITCTDDLTNVIILPIQCEWIMCEDKKEVAQPEEVISTIDLGDYDAVFKYQALDGFINLNSIVANLEAYTQFNSDEINIPHLQSSLEDISAPTNSMSPDTEYIVKLVEDVLLLIRNLCRSKSKEDTAIAIVTFTKLRSSKPFVGLLLNQWEKLMSTSLQSFDPTNTFASLRGLLDNYEAVKNMAIFKKLYKFLLYCLGTSLFDKLEMKFDILRFMKVEKATLKKEFYMGPDFIHCMLDTLLFLCETGYQCMSTGSLDPIFHHETTYEKWLKESELLKVQSKYLSNPEPHGFTVFDFLARIDDAIDKGTAITKFHNDDKYGTKICKYLLNDLKMIRADALTKRLAQQDRKAPFAVLVAGGSSVGKSTFTKMLYYQYGKLFNLPIDPEYRYVRNPFDQYWTNFNSSQWCVQLDDIAYLHPNSSQGCDPSLMEMLQVVNNVPYVPTQAALENKGTTPLRARLVVATTNTESLNAKEYFACPLAVQRRLPYVINIRPRAEYLKDSFMLDSSKVPPTEDGNYPDFWHIEIKRVRPVVSSNTHMGQTGELEIIHVFESIVPFIKWFNSVARDSEGIQDKSMGCDDAMANLALCPCGIPKNMCESCVALQASDIVEYTTPWVSRMSERFEQEQEQESTYDAAHKYTMEHIFQQISLMSIFNRIMVMWYVCLIYAVKKSAIARVLIMWFYGQWYWFFFFCHIMHIPEMRHLAMYLLGYRAYRTVCRNKNVVIFCAAITTTLTVYKTYSFLSSFKKDDEEICKLQGVSADRGSVPQPKGDKAENVWYKDQYVCTQFDFNKDTLSKAKWTMDEFQSFLQGNIVCFNIRYRLNDTTIRERSTKGVCIGGHIYMANNHAFPCHDFELDIIFQSGKDGVTTNITLLVTEHQLLRVPHRDIVFINLPSIPPKRVIKNLFVKNTFRGSFNGQYFARCKDGSIKRNNVKNIQFTQGYKYEDESLEVPIECNMWTGHPDVNTVDGECGSLLLVVTPMGPAIIGMHVLGEYSGKSYSLQLDDIIVDSTGAMMISSNSPTLQVGDYYKHMGPLDKKSTLRYVTEGTAEVYGSLIGFRSKKKSSVTKTFISDTMVDHGYKRVTGPPVMNSWVPWRKAILDMTRPVTHINIAKLDYVKTCFINDILQGLGDSDLAELIVYDNNVAINGRPGLAYVDKLNRNTSAGFPFSKSKQFFLKAEESFGEWQHPVSVTTEIEQEMDNIILTYERGQVYCPVFTASLKDEPTSFKKIDEGKTRVFCGAPMPWSIVVRKYLLSSIRLIQKNRFLFESGPGTIAQSSEWDDIYHYLTAHGTDRIVAGDYGKFDKRMPASVILAAFDIIISILQVAGWTDRELSVVRGIAEDTAFPTIDFNGDLIRCYGTNPSGHPLTVIINGLANSLYVRYCYAESHPDGTCTDFKDNINLMTYGDDMIMGVKQSCTWLDHTRMVDILASIDIQFTMADKDAPSVPFINIKDATFLRRSWRFENSLGKYVCPIEHASIDKMLTMCVASKTISSELQSIEVMNTAIREYFWYGRDIFEQKKNLFLTVIVKLQLDVYMDRPFPTWEQLVDEYRRYSLIR